MEKRHFVAVALICHYVTMEDVIHDLITFMANNTEEIQLILLDIANRDNKHDITDFSVKVLTDGQEDENLSSQMTSILFEMIYNKSKS